jgi:uncharacterized protein YjbI with pentapeptide repeats
VAVNDAMGDETISGNGGPGTKEAEALVSALNRSAERVQTLWFSFLTFMLYLAIATGTTTHRMLFLEEPLNLPVLNIKLPLLGFYVLTPVIFVVLHFYMLLNLVLLARTAKSFEDALVRAFPEDGDARENFRMRIENALFVQLLVGGRLEREGLNARLLSWMALITLALAPVALMLFLEVKFLPYHSRPITWLHRGLLALDLALVCTLWPGCRSGWGVRLWPKSSWWLLPVGVLSAASLAYAGVVATFPDEQMYLATNWLHGSIDLDLSTGRISSHDRPKWYDWIAPINTLDVHGEDLIEDAKLAHITEKNEAKNESSAREQRWVATLPLAGRDLTGVDLSEADIRHVDFSDAILNRANLRYAWAEKARFDHAQLQGASLVTARLQGASLVTARLQGVSLVGAQLQGATLLSAQLQGADLSGARLQGASLDNAQLQGISLVGAQLQGADLSGAQLQNTWLDDAQLAGANLTAAQLQGAWLERVQLQGTLLNRAQLQGAWLAHVYVWRADARAAVWKGTHVTGAETNPKKPCDENDSRPPNEDPNKVYEPNKVCDWTAESSENLIRLLPEQLIGGEERTKALAEMKQSLDPNKALDGEKEMAKVWTDHEQSSRAQKVSRESVARQWVTSAAQQWLVVLPLERLT